MKNVAKFLLFLFCLFQVQAAYSFTWSEEPIIESNDKYVFKRNKKLGEFDDINKTSYHYRSEMLPKWAYLAKRGSKYYLMTTSKKRSIKQEFEAEELSFLYYRHNNFYFKKKTGGKYGIVNQKDKKLTDYIFDDIKATDGAIILTKDGAKYNASITKEGVVYEKDNKYGFFALEDKFSLENNYDYIQNPKYGGTSNYLFVKKKDKYALFTTDGKQETDFIYDDISMSSKTKIKGLIDDKDKTLARGFKSGAISLQQGACKVVNTTTYLTKTLTSWATMFLSTFILAPEYTTTFCPDIPPQARYDETYFYSHD